MASNNQIGYKAIFQENNISDAEAYLVGKENDKRQKAFDKFMAKQLKKPRARYLKQLAKQAKNGN